MDNGYQVGYLDNGEFVEVGRFNNLDAVANSDLEIRHADSETRVVLGDSGFDFDGSDVEGIEALDVQSASVPQVTSNVDFNSNDATGIGALEAEKQSISNLSQGTYRQILDHSIETDAESARGVQYVDGVGSSATPILEFSDGGFTPLSSAAMVVGIDQNDSDNRFCEPVRVTLTSIAVGEPAENESPATRSYSVSGGDLQLAMSSSTYDIFAWGTGVRVR